MGEFGGLVGRKGCVYVSVSVYVCVYICVSRFWVLSHVSAMTPAHVDYIIEFLWGQRYALGDFEEVFLAIYIIHFYYISDF